MLLAVDIGNTNIVIGVFDGADIKEHWRLGTVKERTADEYGIVLSALLDNAGIKPGEITGGIVSCVVPQLKDTFTGLLSGKLGIEPLVVGPCVKTGMPILTDDPREVGADRIVNAVAAYAAHKGPLIVVDFGTAVTFDYVTPAGEYAGGAIAPGIDVSSDALFRRAARLPRVELRKPKTVIGKGTVESMQAGIFYGFVGLVEGLVERIKKETGTRPKVIATGGLAGVVSGESRVIDEVDEFLTLKGLRIIHESNIR
ncbi:MAG: type III pantothenate kinase [Thermodesulfobacteriota bacterium]